MPGACSDGCWLGNGERGVDRFCGPVSISHKEPSTAGGSVSGGQATDQR